MEEHINNLNKRNTVTVEQAIKMMEEKLRAQDDQIEALRTAIAAAINRCEAVEQMVIKVRVGSVGTGPSVKE
jgi:hypothetical protein